jgi:hypothetical protein
MLVVSGLSGHLHTSCDQNNMLHFAAMLHPLSSKDDAFTSHRVWAVVLLENRASHTLICVSYASNVLDFPHLILQL